jgi:hypothetical protein
MMPSTHIESTRGKGLAHSAVLAQGVPLSLPVPPNVAICGEAVILIDDHKRLDARRPDGDVAASLTFIPFGRGESDSCTVAVPHWVKQMILTIMTIMIITAVEQTTYRSYDIVVDVACRRPWSTSTVWCTDGAPAVHTPVEQAPGAAKTSGNGGTSQVECQELLIASEGVCGAQGNRGEKKWAQSPSLSVSLL